MNRRDFIKTSLATGAGVLVAGTAQVASASSAAVLLESAAPSAGRFRHNYAPHFGMFRNLAGDDLIDQIHFMADSGFKALEDNGLRMKSPELQTHIAGALESRGMQMGLFVGTADYGHPTFASGRADLREKVLADMRASVTVSKRLNARYCSIVPGKPEARLPMAMQMQHAVDTIRYCLDVCEPAGLVMLLEPLNHWGARPQLFLSSVSQAVELCRRVNSPCCKILFDIYHQHLAAGSLAVSIAAAWSHIGYFQIGDNPGRKEPGTGDIDYRSLFAALHRRGYRGILGMEHGNSQPGRAGERAVIEAYVEHDRF